MNGGTCIPNYDDDTATCICPSTHRGKYCEEPTRNSKHIWKKHFIYLYTDILSKYLIYQWRWFPLIKYARIRENMGQWKPVFTRILLSTIRYKFDSIVIAILTECYRIYCKKIKKLSVLRFTFSILF